MLLCELIIYDNRIQQIHTYSIRHIIIRDGNRSENVCPSLHIYIYTQTLELVAMIDKINDDENNNNNNNNDKQYNE